MWVQFLGQENPLEKEMATQSNILAWRIPWTRGAWQTIVHRVAKNRTQLKRLSMAWEPKLGRANGSLSLLIQKLISSRNTLTDIPRIMSEKPMAQLSWHIKVTICTTWQTC